MVVEGQMLVVTLTCYVTLHEFHNFPNFHVSQVKSGANNTYFLKRHWMSN